MLDPSVATLPQDDITKSSRARGQVALLSTLARFLDERFITRDVGFGGDDVAGVRRVLLGSEVAPSLARTVHGVAEALRKSIGLLPRAMQIQPQLAFVERALRDTPGTIQLFAESVPDRHTPLVSMAFGSKICDLARQDERLRPPTKKGPRRGPFHNTARVRYADFCAGYTLTL